MGRWSAWLLVLLAGCTNHAGAVRRRAAEQLGCDESQIEVERMHGGGYRARGCGADLTYVCVGGGMGPPSCVREGTSGGERSRSFGSGPAPSSWSDDDVQGFVTSVGRSVMACFPADHPGIHVRVQISERGVITQAVIFDGAADDVQRRCATDAMRAGRLEGVVSTPRTVRVHFTPIVDAVAAAEPPAEEGDAGSSGVEPPTPDEWIRARLDARREHILTCVEAGSVAVLASWDAAGAVTITLRGERAGTSEERCVQATVGPLQLGAPPAEPGSLVHPIARE